MNKEKGEWVLVIYPYYIPSNADYFECSICKHITLIPKHEYSKPCPYCGAENEYITSKEKTL